MIIKIKTANVMKGLMECVKNLKRKMPTQQKCLKNGVNSWEMNTSDQMKK